MINATSATSVTGRIMTLTKRFSIGCCVTCGLSRPQSAQVAHDAPETSPRPPQPWREIASPRAVDPAMRVNRGALTMPALCEDFLGLTIVELCGQRAWHGLRVRSGGAVGIPYHRRDPVATAPNSCAGQVSADQNAYLVADQVGAAQVGVTQVGVTQVGEAQVGAGQVGVAQVGAVVGRSRLRWAPLRSASRRLASLRSAAIRLAPPRSAPPR